MNFEKKKNLFKEFLSNNPALIIDKSSASRRRLLKTIVDLGASRQNVFSVSHISEAKEVIDQNKPKLVLSDFAINGGSGFDLFKYYREQFPDENKSTLILVTSNISQSAVAKAAEEDVDSFIIKPYTVESLEKSLVNAVINKLYPSEYVKTVEAGKEKMFNAEYEEALELFEKAIELNKKPSLAHFYHGQTKYFLEATDEAKGDYEKGLEINSIHFKCQVGLFELFMKEEKFEEAYSVVRNIAKYFPANPDRLKQVVSLCIKTENYPDMLEYYQLFVDLEERPEDVINYVCSGLYVYGKYLLMNNDKDQAKTVFDKVAISCAGMTKFLVGIIEALAQNEIYDLSKKIMSRFPSGTVGSSEYEIAHFLSSIDELNNNEIIDRGSQLFNKGFKNFQAMKILVNALKEEGHETKVEDYLFEMKKTWPHKYIEISEDKKAA